VLFPIPGSPPSKVSEPGTNPPPKTLLNSSSPVLNLKSEEVSISETFKGLESTLALPFGKLRSALLTIKGSFSLCHLKFMLKKGKVQKK